MTLLCDTVNNSTDSNHGPYWGLRVGKETDIYIHIHDVLLQNAASATMPRRQHEPPWLAAAVGEDRCSVHLFRGMYVRHMQCTAQHDTKKQYTRTTARSHCLVSTTFHFSVVVPSKTFHCALRCYSCIVMTRRPTVLMPLQHSF